MPSNQSGPSGYRLATAVLLYVIVVGYLFLLACQYWDDPKDGWVRFQCGLIGFTALGCLVNKRLTPDPDRLAALWAISRGIADTVSPPIEDAISAHQRKITQIDPLSKDWPPEVLR